MLRLIKQSLTVVAYQGKVEPTKVGVPQGSPISPLYSNIYLNLLDQVWHKRGYPEKLGASLHRHADDAILICRKERCACSSGIRGHRVTDGVNDQSRKDPDHEVDGRIRLHRVPVREAAFTQKRQAEHLHLSQQGRAAQHPTTD